VSAYDGTSGAGRLPAGVGLGPIRDGTVGAALDGAPGAGLCGIVGFGTGPDLDPGTDLGDGGLSHKHTATLQLQCHPILSTNIVIQFQRTTLRTSFHPTHTE